MSKLNAKGQLALLTVLALVLLAVPVLGGTESLFGSGPAAGGIAVAIVAILMVFGAPALAIILLVYFILRYREKRQRMMNERIQRFLEAGQPVPESMLQDSVSPDSNPDQHLYQGLMLLGVGIGLTIFLSMLLGFALGSLGLMLVGLGLAKVLIWKLASKRTER